MSAIRGLMLLLLLWLPVMSVASGAASVSWPDELLSLEQQDRLTVRALAAYGLLPDRHRSLAMELRGQGLDLLAADRRRIQGWIDEAALSSAQLDGLKTLLVLMSPPAEDTRAANTVAAKADPAVVTGAGPWYEVIRTVDLKLPDQETRMEASRLLRDPRGRWHVLFKSDRHSEAAIARLDAETLQPEGTPWPLTHEGRPLGYVHNGIFDEEGALIVSRMAMGDASPLVKVFPGTERPSEVIAFSGEITQVGGAFDLDLDHEGNIYVVEAASDFSGVKGVKKFAPDGRFLAFFSGPNGREAHQYGRIRDMRIAADGIIHVGDTHRVKRLSAEGELLNILASPADEVAWRGGSMAVDGRGHVFLADTAHGRILQFSPEGQLLNVIGRQGTDTGEFMFLRDLQVDDAGRLHVLDEMIDADRKHRIRLQILASSDRAPKPMLSEQLHLAIWELRGARDIAVGPDGTLWALTRWEEKTDDGAVGVVRILRLNRDGEWVPHFGQWGTTPEALSAPESLAVGPGGEFYVLDAGESGPPVKVFDAEGRFLRGWGTIGTYEQRAEPGVLRSPRKIRVAPDGTLLITDPMKFGVLRFDTQGNFLHQAGRERERYSNEMEGFPQYPEDAFAVADGRIFMPDKNNGLIQVFDADGDFLRLIRREGGYLGGLSIPKALVVDSRGYILVTEGHHVQAFHGDGSLHVRLGAPGGRDGHFDDPVRIEMAPDDSFYVLDTFLIGDRAPRIQHFRALP
ncbi:NHL repeat-containing protein [Ectothiorhodospira sp. PHS-1]|uniref:NHL repeat-containing protein n=1 Tax=Ectothiorhodospira sp. PHS-1 TaxID=519989 RepID=UPI0011459642|nr:NHL repeat-containing protein [Ectothiorhodospira sp. PHS-1]